MVDRYIEDKNQSSRNDFNTNITNSLPDKDNLENLSKAKLLRIIDHLSEEYDRLYEEYEDVLERVMTDCLTELYNREKMFKDLEKNVKKANRLDDYEFSLAIMDMDNFNKINNIFGHDVGDQVLITIGDYLSNYTRDYENAYRHGGDEFAAILENMDMEGALDFVERIYEGITEIDINENSQIVSDSNNDIELDTSIGITSYRSDMDLEKDKAVELLYKVADRAMYISKNNDKPMTYVDLTDKELDLKINQTGQDTST